MKKEKLDVIIETFTDYIENYYDENNEAFDLEGVVEDNFEEFADWACDDFVINEEEKDAKEETVAAFDGKGLNVFIFTFHKGFLHFMDD